MRELQTEIEITAPITKVWEILTDFDNWKKWNPIINQASGTASLGSKLNITMRDKDSKDGQKYMPIITSYEKPILFIWRANMIADFLFTNEKIFKLEEMKSGTRLIHIEGFSGIFVPIFWSKLNKFVIPMLQSMNNALKIKVEKGILNDY